MLDKQTIHFCGYRAMHYFKRYVKIIFMNTKDYYNELPALIKSFHQLEYDLDDDKIDALLGIGNENIEKGQTYGDLADKFGDEQFTYEATPYNFIKYFLKVLKPKESDVLYDLGSGYGRIPLYGALTSPGKYIGIEIVPERVKKSNEIKRKLNIETAFFWEGNVLNYDLEDGTIFFLFNPFVIDTLNQVGNRLEKIAQKHPIKIVTWGSEYLSEFFENKVWLKKMNISHQKLSFFKTLF
jgi:SAM-dependent methyltransferase